MKRSPHNSSLADGMDPSLRIIRGESAAGKVTRTGSGSAIARKKILYIDNRSQYFVVNRLPLAIATRDQLAEVHVTTLSRREEDVEIISLKKLSFHRLRSNANDRSLVTPLLMALQLARLLKELQPDLIHLFTLKAMCVASLALLLVRKRAAIMSPTGLGYTFSSRTLKARLLRTGVSVMMPPLLRRAGDGFVFQNTDDLSFFRDQFQIPRERLHMIRGSGVDISRYKMSPENKGVPTVVLVARMLRDKGVFEYIDAARQLKLQGVEARFLLVGDTDSENPAGIDKAQLTEWHNSGSVEWRGYCQDIASVFSEAHIVCLPSYREGAPRVLLEAAACGRPVITTDVPGCREVVTHRETGLLVPARDSRALAIALSALISDPELRISMGRKGREFVKREFSLEKVITANFRLYEKLLVSYENSPANWR